MSHGEVIFSQAQPIMRIFDAAKAKEFYLGLLGFNLDWEHRFGDHFPLYAQVSRGGVSLHLSEHHGDASPGATVVVPTQNIEQFQRELDCRNDKHVKPHLEDQPWGWVMTITDPFNNRIRFIQAKPANP
jgi:catechol 2,3-dioxygenase-like lactoylglutathione lyase family enzyme